MKKFSPKITDGELMELFREAVENHEPLYSLRDKEELWDRIRSEDSIPYRRGIRKKFLSWLPLMLVLLFLGLFLGASLRVGDSLLKMGKPRGTREAAVYRAEEDRRSIQQIGAIQRREPGNRQRDEPGNRRTPGAVETRVVEIPVLAEIGKGQPGPADQWHTLEGTDKRHILEGGRNKQGRAGLLSGRGDERRKPEAPVVSKAPGTQMEKDWSIGATLGTDWSMVKDAGGERPGLDGGVLVEYRFARRWSVESGLSVASKIYAARPKDYHSAASYPGLLSVNAECRVFDLPINIRYDLLQKGNSRLFASTGLSSFWMQKEDYSYKSDINGSLLSSKRTIYNQNRYFLSIANFAFGYEYAWNKFSLQASPYLKLPLSGIGYGKVDLISTGILLSVKRRL